MMALNVAGAEGHLVVADYIIVHFYLYIFPPTGIKCGKMRFRFIYSLI